MKGQLNHLPTSDSIESNPMSHEGHVKWELENNTFIDVYFEYLKDWGIMYISKISYSGSEIIEDKFLHEAVSDTLGPCQFDNTEITRI